MEDVERREARYREGGLNPRLGSQILLQRLHQGDISLNIPQSDPGGSQWFRIEA